MPQPWELVMLVFCLWLQQQPSLTLHIHNDYNVVFQCTGLNILYTCTYKWKFSPEENVCQFHHLRCTSWELLYTWKFLLDKNFTKPSYLCIKFVETFLPVCSKGYGHWTCDGMSHHPNTTDPRCPTFIILYASVQLPGPDGHPTSQII